MDFEKISTQKLKSQENTPHTEAEQLPQDAEKSITRDWLKTDKLDTKIATSTIQQSIDESQIKPQIPYGSDWYSHNEQTAIKSVEEENINTIERDGIIYQLTGKPLTPETGTGTYVYGHYDRNKPTIALVNGMGAPSGFSELVDKEQENNNIVMISIDHSKPINENVQQIITELEQMEKKGIKINELVSHSAGNRFTLEMLHELGIQNNDLLNGVEIIGLNPKIADDNAEGHSTGVSGFFTNIAGKITGGNYENIVTMMDAQNSKNRYLNGELANIHKALGSGKLSFIVATNDPHNPDNTTSAGAIFHNVLKHADTVKYITPPNDPHDWLLKN